MRKSFAWLICMVFVYVLICASSDNYMKWLTKQRSNQPEILTSDKYTFGDLYGFSFLPQFRFKTVLPNYLTLEKIHHQNGKLDFYILGDSYLYSFFDKKTEYFANTRSLSFTRWTENIAIDPKKLKSSNSVLLVECVERNAFSRLNLPEITTRIGFAQSKNTSIASIPKSDYTLSVESINEWIKGRFYHSNLETNLDFVLFSRGVYRLFKEWKASLNLYFFNRTDNFVVLSKDASFLYLKETVDSTQISSSFYPYSNQELDEFVTNLNEINDYYLKAGFKKVLISIPANPVAILKTEELPTNDLLNRLKNHPSLKVEIVDPSDSLKVNASQNYFKSDSHWNNNGAKIWLAYLNRSLEKI
jgi:hypothetical protein